MGQGLTAIAHGNDGLVEAIENKEKHVLAVQWHPERTWETEHFDKKIFEKIVREWELTIDVLKKITGNDVLLADNPELASSLKNRLAYFDSMNYLQVELLKRLRNGDESDELKKAIHISINGLATGLRNSG